jgi:hypothetical protein
LTWVGNSCGGGEGEVVDKRKVAEDTRGTKYSKYTCMMVSFLHMIVVKSRREGEEKETRGR